MNKISIRFYKDHQVRAVWDECEGVQVSARREDIDYGGLTP